MSKGSDFIYINMNPYNWDPYKPITLYAHEDEFVYIDDNGNRIRSITFASVPDMEQWVSQYRPDLNNRSMYKFKGIVNRFITAYESPLRRTISLNDTSTWLPSNVLEFDQIELKR